LAQLITISLLLALIMIYGTTTGLTSGIPSFYVGASEENGDDTSDTPKPKHDTDRDGTSDDEDIDDDNDGVPDQEDDDDDNDNVPDDQDTDDDNDNLPDDQDTDDDNDGISDEDEIIPTPTPIPTPSDDNDTIPADDNDTIPVPTPADDNGTIPIPTPVIRNDTQLNGTQPNESGILFIQTVLRVNCPPSCENYFFTDAEITIQTNGNLYTFEPKSRASGGKDSWSVDVPLGQAYKIHVGPGKHMTGFEWDGTYFQPDPGPCKPEPGDTCKGIMDRYWGFGHEITINLYYRNLQ
jgi:hypothetical protein